MAENDVLRAVLQSVANATASGCDCVAIEKELCALGIIDDVSTHPIRRAYAVAVREMHRGLIGPGFEFACSEHEREQARRLSLVLASA